MAAGRRRTVRALLALVGLMVLAQVVGWYATDRGGLVLIQELDRPADWAAASVLALTTAVMVGAKDATVKSLVLALVVVLAFVTIPLHQFAEVGWKVTERQQSPVHAERRLVVEQGLDMIDPVWMVYLEQGGGLGERRWHLGYFNGDSDASALVDAAWDGPDRIRLVQGGGQVEVIELAPDGSPRGSA
ncbi:hypothetical protein ACIRBX_09765 [Kitasatospora sp. NPDC096147]|uniref:hypothetical protein n=1 Tax=Kitasatospora sp. NPDC096147 TaxID=3364093 RepID=UPI003830C71C